MAVRRPWIKNAIIALAAIILLFSLSQLGLTVAHNVIFFLNYSSMLNSIIEAVGIGLFLIPSIWIGIAAGVSRHRGVYVLLTVMSSLALLMAVGFIVYEAYVFSFIGYFSSDLNGTTIQILTILKLVNWSILLLLLICYLGVAIAADCAQEKPDFKYMSYGPRPNTTQYMPEYATRSVKEIPRAGSSRYLDYPPPPTPRMYYKGYY